MRDRGRGTLGIIQSKYIELILERYGMQGANLVATPLDTNIKLEPHEGGETTTTERSNYASLKGSLMYAAIRTHPYIAYATNKLCSFNKNLDLLNWTTAKHVL